MAIHTAGHDVPQTAPDNVERPWQLAYPEARSEPASISRDDMLRLIKSGEKSYVLVDLRRDDFEASTLYLEVWEHDRSESHL